MSGRLALANAIDGAGIEQSEGRTEPGQRRMTRSDTLAVGKVKLGDRDRRNRAIVKRLAAGASTRAVGAEFGLTPAQISRIRVQVTGVRQRPTYAPWPTKRIARLRLLWRRGLSAAEIGRLLGVPDVCPWALDEFLVEGEGALCWKPT